jgi:hypothetical protein
MFYWKQMLNSGSTCPPYSDLVKIGPPLTGVDSAQTSLNVEAKGLPGNYETSKLVASGTQTEMTKPQLTALVKHSCK